MSSIKDIQINMIVPIRTVHLLLIISLPVSVKLSRIEHRNGRSGRGRNRDLNRHRMYDKQLIGRRGQPPNLRSSGRSDIRSTVRYVTTSNSRRALHAAVLLFLSNFFSRVSYACQSLASYNRENSSYKNDKIFKLMQDPYFSQIGGGF